MEIPRPKQSEKAVQHESGSAEHDALGAPFESRGGDPASDWRRERWASKYNKQWAAIIHVWATLLTSAKDGRVRAFGLEDGAGIDAVFTISQFTGWSRPGHHHTYFDRTK